MVPKGALLCTRYGLHLLGVSLRNALAPHVERADHKEDDDKDDRDDASERASSSMNWFFLLERIYHRRWRFHEGSIANARRMPVAYAGRL